MSTVASYPQTWFSNTVDPRFINTDCSWSINNPWPVNESTWTPAIDAINQYFLPYGQDAFLSGPPPSPILSSFERTDTPSVGASYEPSSHFLPLQDIFQDVLPETQHSLSPQEEGFTSQCPLLQHIFQGNMSQVQQSAYSSTESYNGRHIVAVPSQVLSSRKTVIEPDIESGRVTLYDRPSSTPRRNPPSIQFTHESLATLSPYTSYLLPPKSLEAKKYHQRKQQFNTYAASFKLEPGSAPDRVQPSPSLSIPPSASTSRTPSPSTQFTMHASARGTMRRGSPTIHETNSDPDCIYTIILDARGRKMYQCKTCPEIRTYHKGDMNRHMQSSRHMDPSHQCTFCPKVFSRLDALKRHLEDMHLVGERRPKLKRKPGLEAAGSVGVRPRKRSKTSGPF